MFGTPQWQGHSCEQGGAYCGQQAGAEVGQYKRWGSMVYGK